MDAPHQGSVIRKSFPCQLTHPIHRCRRQDPLIYNIQHWTSFVQYTPCPIPYVHVVTRNCVCCYLSECPTVHSHFNQVKVALQWRHNGHGSISNHQLHDCLLNRLFRRRSKKTSKLRVTGLCAVNSPGTGEFPAQMVSNLEKVSIWWRHQEVSQSNVTMLLPQIHSTTEELYTRFALCCLWLWFGKGRFYPYSLGLHHRHWNSICHFKQSATKRFIILVYILNYFSPFSELVDESVPFIDVE